MHIVSGIHAKQLIRGSKMLARPLPALRLRPAAARALSSASLSSHRSVKVSVSDGVELHALVPVEDGKDKTPVVCLPSAFGASVRHLRVSPAAGASDSRSCL